MEEGEASLLREVGGREGPSVLTAAEKDGPLTSMEALIEGIGHLTVKEKSTRFVAIGLCRCFLCYCSLFILLLFDTRVLEGRLRELSAVLGRVFSHLL